MLFAAACVAAVLTLGTVAGAVEITIGAANMREYVDPGRDHSNVGSMQYINTLYAHREGSEENNAGVPTGARQLENDLADHYRADHTEGVVFHNGDPMTADDVVFSLERMFTQPMRPMSAEARSTSTIWTERRWMTIRCGCTRRSPTPSL